MHTAGALSDDRSARELIRRSENPYATLYYETEHDDDETPVVIRFLLTASHEKTTQMQHDSQVRPINQRTK